MVPSLWSFWIMSCTWEWKLKIIIVKKNSLLFSFLLLNKQNVINVINTLNILDTKYPIIKYYCILPNSLIINDYKIIDSTFLMLFDILKQTFWSLSLSRRRVVLVKTIFNSMFPFLFLKSRTYQLCLWYEFKVRGLGYSNCLYHE